MLNISIYLSTYLYISIAQSRRVARLVHRTEKRARWRDMFNLPIYLSINIYTYIYSKRCEEKHSNTTALRPEVPQEM